ncbi:hypothetical protein HanPSC8_Chr12g0541441 [Helianthus annuus]|nr:hypothetical protein HanPSC8_Chr12g0541441 [Helianthus annuus]
MITSYRFVSVSELPAIAPPLDAPGTSSTPCSLRGWTGHLLDGRWSSNDDTRKPSQVPLHGMG